jgi:hypothetical protein
MNLAEFVIPINGEAKVSRAIPVSVAFVVLFEYCEEMLGIGFVYVLDAKIIDDEGEADGLPCMSPKTWCGCALSVASLE